jgi:homoserine kinase
MRELAKGNTKQNLVFRPGDVLEELADEFNAMCASLDRGIPLGEGSGSSSRSVQGEPQPDHQSEPVEV